MNEADVVLDKAIKTNQDPTIILKPCKQSLNFPGDGYGSDDGEQRDEQHTRGLVCLAATRTLGCTASLEIQGL